MIYEPGQSNPYWGDVKLSFADGHSEMVTHGNKSHDVRISSSGMVGWVQITGTPPKSDYRGDQDYLMIRTPDGNIQKLKPNSPASSRSGISRTTMVPWSWRT